MAELPDLTVFANILCRKFKGRVLLRIDVTEARKLYVEAAVLRSSLEGKKLTGVVRAGKTLQLKFDGDQVLGLHLMLRGELVDLSGEEVPRFQVMAFHFDDGNGFAVIDLLKQATATLNPDPVPAPDALELDKEYFRELLAKRRMIIKTLLMDQKAMRGIGNSYADEILYHAGVSPFSTASAIPSKFKLKIYDSIRIVLTNAAAKIEEANDDRLSGELKDFMEIHNPGLKSTAKGEKIKTGKIAGRTTYYTDHQQLFL